MKFRITGKGETVRSYVITLTGIPGEQRYTISDGFDVVVSKDGIFGESTAESASRDNKQWFERIQLGQVWELKPTNELYI